MKQQYVFIDDSGDPGFKFNRGSAQYFVVVCIVFDDSLDAEFAGVSIKKLKRNLGWRLEHEFKFNKNTYEQRIAFLRAAKKYDFKVRAVVVNKMKLKNPPKTGDTFYRFIIRELLARYDNLRQARVYLDGSAGRNYRNRSASYLRKRLNKTGRKIVEFKVVDSKSDTLIQLADIIAGSIRRKYDESKTDHLDYFNIIRPKIEDIWEYE